MILNTFCIWFERLGFGAPSLHIPSRVCRFLQAQQKQSHHPAPKIELYGHFFSPILRTATCRHFLLRKTCRKFSRIRANIKRQARQPRTEEDVSSKLRSTVSASIWKWNAWTFSWHNLNTELKPQISYISKKGEFLFLKQPILFVILTGALASFNFKKICGPLFFQLKENLWPFWMTRGAPTAQSQLSN